MLMCRVVSLLFIRDRIAAGARRLGRLARRPQTGVLHQYYAQLVVALAALALLLLLSA
jgi:NADH-quinone oxidoreductase subunit L